MSTLKSTARLEVRCNPGIVQILKDQKYIAHIPPRDELKRIIDDIPNYRARRWVVERTHSWLNRFRCILIRWEKKKENYLAMLHLACAWMAVRSIQVFG